ncbi:hypothetical protein PYW08_006178 [Mythimna loreyi]|uniref:Uncharacterized protein n=1 Tax=Mythimna loreyi TaxID=667449 RepID=A0ACC2QMF5_9NEOP|nr:hypothetical protein PYW08_006178 [Mythimna loreyi]
MASSFKHRIEMIITAASLEALDEDMFLYWRRSRSDSTKCEPFTSYFISCNKCVCSADGTEFCTRMACFSSNKLLGKLLSTSKKQPVKLDNLDNKEILEYDMKTF